MSIRRILLPFALVVLGGCASTSYTLVAPSVVSLNELQVTPNRAWNRAPGVYMPFLRKGSEVWTHDGLELDRILIITGVADGEAIFIDKQGQAALPRFRPSMLPNELQELAESSLAKYFGEGESTVSGKNLRPQRFGEHNGVLFDIDAAVADGPDYKGLVGTFIANNKLYLMIYIAADPHYFDRYLADATALIKGARVGTGAEAAL
jgi:hypothetical protein